MNLILEKYLENQKFAENIQTFCVCREQDIYDEANTQKDSFVYKLRQKSKVWKEYSTNQLKNVKKHSSLINNANAYLITNTIDLKIASMVIE